jgi:hypothetical protein
MGQYQLVYELRTITDTSFEIELVHLASELASFLDLNPVFRSTKGVYIINTGPRLVLGPRNPLNGGPEDIILPRLQGKNSSWTSEMWTGAIQSTNLPRPSAPQGLQNPETKGIKTGASEYSGFLGEGLLQYYMSFRCRKDKEIYINQVYGALSDLVQASLNTRFGKDDQVLTLIVIN